MAAIQWTDVAQRLKWEATPEGYDRIRTVWLKHCDTELRQDMEGLLSTLTEDCVYTVLRTTATGATRQRWDGQEGARAFYTALFQAFPDQNWQPEAVVIGPQGVCEEARVTGTHRAAWLGHEATGERLTWNVVIFFPWDEERRLFRGEKVYTAGLPLPALGC